MKTLKLFFGVLAALWTIGVIFGSAPDVLSGDFSWRGISSVAGSFLAIVICAAVTIWLFQSALRNPPEDTAPLESEEEIP